VKRYFDTDKQTGATQTWEEVGDDISIGYTTRDIGPEIERNKRWANDGTNGWNKSRDMVHVAHIPIDVVYKWVELYGICAWKKEHQDDVRRLLNDADWRYLRVSNIII
jgi:hypothetical protein